MFKKLSLIIQIAFLLSTFLFIGATRANAQISTCSGEYGQCIFDHTGTNGFCNSNKQWCAYAQAECGRDATSGEIDAAKCANGRGIAPGGFCLTSTICSTVEAGPVIKCGVANDARCTGSSPGPSSTPTGVWTQCGSCNCTEAGVGDRGPECQRNPQGQCVWNPSLCGPGATPPPPKPVCGEACSVTSDCAPAAGFGIQVTCRNGRCENAACPAGQTVFGANCTCGANAQRCGQPCGHAFGLCAEGVCRYVNVSSPGYCPWGWPETYCVGTQNGYKNKQCTVGDTPGAYLEGPNGKLVGFTVQEMQASCQLCGDGVVQTPEMCDAGSKNGTAETTCGIDCKYTQATPTPTPLPFVCVGVSKDIADPKLGQSVRFTCTTVTGATSYEFRYQRIPPPGEQAEGISEVGAIAPTTTGSNVTLPFAITKSGTYKVQCRPCKDSVCLPFEVL